MLKSVFGNIEQLCSDKEFMGEHKIAILTENVDGVQYLLTADTVTELVEDWNGDCTYVPSNDTPVEGLWLSGEKKELPEGASFEEVLKLIQ